MDPELPLSNRILILLNLYFPNKVLMNTTVTGVNWLVFFMFLGRSVQIRQCNGSTCIDFLEV